MATNHNGSAEHVEMLNHGTFDCVACGYTFDAENPCCCDEALYSNGSHRDGVCGRCCTPGHAAIFNQHYPGNQRGE